MEEFRLPETDTPDVMQQAVSLWLTNVIWDQHSRGVHPDKIEQDLLELYDRVYKAVRKAHSGE